jgi:Ca2+-binding RTX toxin-like protein
MARKTKIGTNANDRLDGLDGLFNLFGKAGNDLYLIDQASDRVFETANKGTDTVRIYDIRTYTLPSHVENLTVWDTGLTATFRGNGLDNKLDARFIGFKNLAADVKLYGLTGKDYLIASGGDDRLDGGTGADKMTGGFGHDTYIVDHTSDRVFESQRGASTTRDQVLSSVNFTLPTNIEHLTLTGSANRNATGNAEDNILKGNAGANRLTGLLGRDFLDGGGGADTFVFTSIDDSNRPSSFNGGDTIRNFRFSQGDRIDLTAFDLNFTFAGLLNGTDTFSTDPAQIAFNSTFNVILIKVAAGSDFGARGEMIIRLEGNVETPTLDWFVF